MHLTLNISGVNPFMLETMAIVVWTYDDFDNNFGFKNNFTIFLERSCVYGSVPHFSLKYFQKNPLITKILSK